MPVKAGYLLLAGGGGVFVWSGLKGKSVSSAFRQLAGGDSPTAASAANPVSGVASTSATANSSAVSAVTGGPAANPSALQKYAFTLFQLYDWGTDQQQALINLWNQESGWNPSAQNPTSTAYGIAQFLDTTWGPYGPKTSNADLQIQYGLEYIHDRYGTPAAAWAHEQAYNWY